MSFEAPPKLRSYKEAIIALEDVSHFLLYKGHVDEAVRVGTATDAVSQLALSSTTQTTLHSFFT